MIAAITGPRTGATQPALLSVTQTLIAYNVSVLHDGDATGVDEATYYLARALGIHVILHPPVNSKWRAFCGILGNEYDSHNTWRPEKPFKVRDRDMVDESEFLIGVPKQSLEPFTGGTGYTVEYARSVGKPVVLILPNGFAIYERWETLNV